ncbi:MAG: hypothetical protein AB7G17_00765 [Phycisphaerales bacterium]
MRNVVMSSSLIAAALLSSSAPAAVTTWLIDQPWDFYTSSTPPQTNLVGSITFDSSISNYYPVSWSFTLTHFDPIFTPNYPITIEGAYPNIFDAPGIAWDFRRDAFTLVRISFGNDAATVGVLQNGTQSSVTFSANEYVQTGPNSSQRIIYSGTATLAPAPGAAVLMGLAALTAAPRRRSRR